MSKRVTFVGLAVFALSCVPQPPGPSDININNTLTNNAGGGGNGASPSPGTGGGTLPVGSTVRVGLFGQSCPQGVPVPNNSLGQIGPGCIGFVTATPKGPDGIDLPPSVHGPFCTWSVTSGQSLVTLSTTGEAFNRDVRCGGAGPFGLAAVVKDVTGQRDFSCLAGPQARAFAGQERVYFFEPWATEKMRADAIARGSE